MSEWETGAGFIANGTQGHKEDDKLIVFFKWEALEIKAKVQDGIPEYKDVEWVEIRQSGARDPLFEGPVTELHKKRFKVRYDAWKATRENPMEGLPLEEWPSITKAIVMHLRARGVRTVQELANVPDSLLSELMLYGSQTRQKARDWIADGKNGAMTLVLRQENEKLKEALEFEKKRISYLESQVAELGKGGIGFTQSVQAPAPVVDIGALVAAEIAKAMAAQVVAAPAVKAAKKPTKKLVPIEEVTE